MLLRINGAERQVEGCESVADLLRVMAVDPARVAVLVNEAVVPSAGRADHRLRDGDRLEIVTFVAGG